MRIAVTIMIPIICFMSQAQGAAEAYQRTEPGVIEIKTLPAGRLLEHRADSGRYFDQSNSLFGPLFRYIQRHDISMTTPVEARMKPGTMLFWVSEDQRDKADKDEGDVRIIDIPERSVAVIGVRGAYSQENFEDALGKLMAWIEEQGDLTLLGQPFAAYWNGPCTPWSLKTFEALVEFARQE